MHGVKNDTQVYYYVTRRPVFLQLLINFKLNKNILLTNLFGLLETTPTGFQQTSLDIQNLWCPYESPKNRFSYEASNSC